MAWQRFIPYKFVDCIRNCIFFLKQIDCFAYTLIEYRSNETSVEGIATCEQDIDV